MILLKDEFQLMTRISINEMDRVRQRMVELVDGEEERTKEKKMKKQKRKGRRREEEEERREKEKGQLSRK